MNISVNRVVVERIEEPKKEGFETVEVQDSSVYKGRVVSLPETSVYMGNQQLILNDTILFAKYSPDTHEIEHEGKKLKFIKIDDILAVV